MPLEALPEEVQLEVLDETGGHRLRLDAQGRWLEAWSNQPERVRSTRPPPPPYPDAARLRASVTLETWVPLLRGLDGQEFVSVSRVRGPNGRDIEPHALVFRVRDGQRVFSVRATGDLGFPATLGPLEAAWRDLSRQVYGLQE